MFPHIYSTYWKTKHIGYKPGEDMYGVRNMNADTATDKMNLATIGWSLNQNGLLKKRNKIL